MHLYLLDVYSYVQAVAAAAPAVLGAYEGAAGKIAGECRGVLVGAPRDDESEGDSSFQRPTARQRGEQKRQHTQLGDLEEELSTELASAERKAQQPAATAFLAKLKALPQGGPALSQIVHLQTVRLEEEQQAESTDVCADMRAWATSDFHTLSPDSRAIALKRETEFVRLLTELATQSAIASKALVETPADRALTHKTSQLETRTAKAIAKPIESAEREVQVALGLTTQATLEEEMPKPRSHESTTSTELHKGRTAAGTRYTVWLERTKGGSARACKSHVEVRGADGATPGLLELLSASRPEVCLAPHEKRAEEPKVNCHEGLLTIEAEVPTATREVDLHMSDNRQIVSRPVLVPRRLGGPAALYYQAVRGPSPIPVSLTERDAHGNPLRVLELHRIVGCAQHLVKYLPGGKRTLVRASTPTGLRFSIVGERYRRLGRLHIQLKLATGEQATSSGEGEEEEGEGEGPGEPVAVPVRHAAPLDSKILAGCYPHEYSILYGLLKNPRDTVLAKVAGELAPVPRVRIPGSLHAGGQLVYLATIGRPEELLVRSPGGKIVIRQDLSGAAREGRETCEGESEGPGPPPGALAVLGETSKIVLRG